MYKLYDVERQINLDFYKGEKAQETIIPSFYFNSRWAIGVRWYAGMLLNSLIENRNLAIDDDVVKLGKIQGEDLLMGASDWKHYSYGGCALISNEDICRRLSIKSEIEGTHIAELPPAIGESWLDVQAVALRQAAILLTTIVNTDIDEDEEASW